MKENGRDLIMIGGGVLEASRSEFPLQKWVIYSIRGGEEENLIGADSSEDLGAEI